MDKRSTATIVVSGFVSLALILAGGAWTARWVGYAFIRSGEFFWQPLTAQWCEPQETIGRLNTP